MRQYKIISAEGHHQLEAELNRLAAENWRPVTMTHDSHARTLFVVLERERPYTPSGGPEEIADGN